MTNPKRKLNQFFTLSGIALFSVAPITSIADEDEGQEFLFLLDEGYVQESGEWQINAIADFNTEESEQELEIEVEYGFTDHFQIEVEIEYENEEDASEFGPIGVELSYGWEASDIAFAIGVNTAIPTESEQDSSYGLSLRSSTDIFDDIFIHGNIGYQEDDNNEEETTYGVALAFTQWSSVNLLFEVMAIDANTAPTTTEGAIGVYFPIIDDLNIGVSYVTDIDGNADTNQIVFQLSTEW